MTGDGTFPATQADFDAALAKVKRAERELDITSADNIVLWLEANAVPGEPVAEQAAWLACRIVEAYERAATAIGANGQTVSILSIRGVPVEVDAEIAPIVAALNACGVETIASCSGHGARPANIALRDGREIVIARNYDEARKIDRALKENGQTVSPDSPWRDIATAPRDGTWFLACSTMKGWGATRVVRFSRPDDRLPIHGEGGMWPSAPTHWQPLPTPPVTEGEGCHD